MSTFVRRPMLIAVVAAVAVAVAVPRVLTRARGPEPSNDRSVVVSALRHLGWAQDRHAAAHGRYATDAADLAPFGYEPDPRVRTRVVRADADGYCASASGAGTLVLYWDSAAQQVSPDGCGS